MQLEADALQEQVEGTIAEGLFMAKDVRGLSDEEAKDSAAEKLASQCKRLQAALQTAARVRRARRTALTSQASPLQPQINAEQWQAVADVMAGQHGGVPYVCAAVT